MSGFDESRKERSWSINSEAVSRSELFLVSHENYLFCVNSSKESLILFDHRSLVHNNPLEFAIRHDFRGRFSHGGHDNWFIFDDLLLERFFVPKELLELLSGEFFDSFDIVAEKVGVFLV